MFDCLHRCPATPAGPAASLPWQGFMPASRVMTRDGEQAVEHLRPGDLVVLMCRPRLARVVRVTEMVVDLARHPEAAPVIILEGAIADASPARAFEVAPDTLLDFRDALIPAQALVNGISVLRFGGVGRMRYLHLETPEHEINVVDGLRVASAVTSAALCRPIGDAAAISRARALVEQRARILHERGWQAGSGLGGMRVASWRELASNATAGAKGTTGRDTRGAAHGCHA